MKLISLFLILTTLLQAQGIEEAKTYHNNSNLQWHVAMQTLDLTAWEESERILDIGCGDGKITALLATNASKGSVLGVDISQSMIDFATAHYPKTDYPNLNFQRQDAAELPFENQFDKVVSFSALHWVLDQAKALKAMHRALIAGGKLCIHTYGKGTMNVTCIADDLVHTEKWAPHFPTYTKQRAFFTEQEYQTLLQQAGFQEVQVIGSWNETLFANAQAVTDFAKPLLNFIRHLPQGLQQEFTAEVVEKILSIAEVSEDGDIHYRTFNLQALGVKPLK